MRRRRFLSGAVWSSALSASFAPLSGSARTLNRVSAGDKVVPKTPKNAVALSGASFSIDSDIYQLTDIISPGPNALLASEKSYAKQAQETLSQLLKSHSFTLVGSPAKNIKDTPLRTRWGHYLVSTQPVTHDQSLESLLLLAGASRVMPSTSDYQRLSRLLNCETKAREEGKGLWAYPHYRVRNANNEEDLRDAIGTLTILEGRVQKVGQSRSRLFLNFGEDYKEDVTVVIPASSHRGWEKMGMDVSVLDGKIIRARGYMEWINGPSLKVTHPMALEFPIPEANPSDEKGAIHPLLSDLNQNIPGLGKNGKN